MEKYMMAVQKLTDYVDSLIASAICQVTYEVTNAGTAKVAAGERLAWLRWAGCKIAALRVA
jgi:hypothetical protein